MYRLISFLLAIFLVGLCFPGMVFAKGRGGHVGHPGTFNYHPQHDWVYQSPSGDFKSAWQLLVQADTMSINGADQLDSGGKIPNFKLYWTMSYNHWYSGFSYNFANPRQQQLQNVILGYNWKHLSVMGGQFAMMYGLANSAAENAIEFLQSPLPVLAFNPSYGIGSQAIAFSQHFSVIGSVFIPQLNSHVDGSKPYGEILRALYVPWHQKGKDLHFGISLWEQGVDRSHQVEFSAMPEVVTPNSASLVDTGTINNAKNYFTADLEFALVRDRWALQSEYIRNWLNRGSGYSNLSFSGYYANLSYFLSPGVSMKYAYPYGYFSGTTPITKNMVFGSWLLNIVL